MGKQVWVLGKYYLPAVIIRKPR